MNGDGQLKYNYNRIRTRTTLNNGKSVWATTVSPLDNNSYRIEHMWIDDGVGEYSVISSGIQKQEIFVVPALENSIGQNITLTALRGYRIEIDLYQLLIDRGLLEPNEQEQADDSDFATDNEEDDSDFATDNEEDDSDFATDNEEDDSDFATDNEEDDSDFATDE